MLIAQLTIAGILFSVWREGRGIQDPDLALAKRSLLQRERQYIQDQPLSEDLLEFIGRYKRRNPELRLKRSQDLGENVYIIQNGQLVPVNTAKNSKRNDAEDAAAPIQAFTVVPLVIPLVNANQHRSKLVKTRTLTDDAEDVALNGAVAPAAPPPPTAKPAPGKGSSETEEDDDKDTQAETQVLQKILQDVEGLMQSRQESTKKEGVLCSLNGSWISDAAGMRFDIDFQNSTRKKFRIHVADRIPPNEDGFLCDGNWTLFGELPFSHSSLIIVLAVHQKDKHLATFIGECRVCEGSETVTGTWLLGRNSRDCKDQKVAHKILSDIWKREQAHNLRKKHLQQLGYNATDED